MYHKAYLMGDFPRAQAILNAKTPYEAKKIGRRVAYWDEDKWVADREKIMFNALMLKVEQHPSLRHALLATGSWELAEAAPNDTVWGIGATRGSTQWRGQVRWCPWHHKRS